MNALCNFIRSLTFLDTEQSTLLDPIVCVDNEDLFPIPISSSSENVPNTYYIEYNLFLSHLSI